MKKTPLRFVAATQRITADVRENGFTEAQYNASCTLAINSALARAATARMLSGAPQVLVASASMLVESAPISDGLGAPFVIPLVLPEDMPSGDGRTFAKNAISLRDLPLPLLWQIMTDDAHDSSVVVGRIDSIERTPNGMGNARGFFDTGIYGVEAERLVRNQMLRFVSADLDDFEARDTTGETAADASSSDEDDDSSVIKAGTMTVTNGRVIAATIVAKPAFQECKIMIDTEAETATAEIIQFPDGEYIDTDVSLVASAAVPTALTVAPDSLLDVPVMPPSAWFEDPKLTGPTPLTVDKSGRVFGHIAAWDVPHIGMPNGTTVPRSYTDYAYFNTGVIECDDDKLINVGQLTLSGGHASLSADAATAAAHYDNTKSGVADVHAGQDMHGVWVAGAIRPGVTRKDLRVFRASAPSGDWRNIGGSLELVAVCQVNVPGFPTVRAMVAAGKITSLVAAGVQALARGVQLNADMMREAAATASMRFAAQPDTVLVASAGAVAARFKSTATRVSMRNALAAAAALQREDDASGLSKYMSLCASASETDKAAAIRRRISLGDGSLPIRSARDLAFAITLADRKNDAVMRAHVTRRARVLGLDTAIPEGWSERLMTAGQLYMNLHGK